MRENPEAIVFAARMDIEQSISKLKHARQESSLDSLEEYAVLQAEHDLWEVAKRLRAFEESR
jgi:hypothetical protein